MLGNRFTQELEKLLGPGPDFKVKSIPYSTCAIHLCYLQSAADETVITEKILEPLKQRVKLEQWEWGLITNLNVTAFTSVSEAVKELQNGAAAVWLEEDRGYLLQAPRTINDSVDDATIETSLLGPQHAFSEDLGTSLALLRRRYHNPTLRVEARTLGAVTKTRAALIYDEQFADQALVEQIRQKLDSVALQTVQAVEELVPHLTGRRWQLVQTVLISERPDRFVYNLSLGKIGILLEGANSVLILPVAFYDFISSMEDHYHSYWVRRFLLALRYAGLFITVMLPGFYVAVTSHNPELFRVQLALSIAGSRTSVPYPSFLEVLFMLLMMELLTEASVRLPKNIGSAATTVGGLILGQSAAAAGLVSDIMIIIVAAVAISNYIIPIHTFGLSIRLMKYILLLFAVFTGTIGVISAIFLLLAYLFSLESFGRPYLTMEFPSHPGSGHR